MNIDVLSILIVSCCAGASSIVVLIWHRMRVSRLREITLDAGGRGMRYLVSAAPHCEPITDGSLALNTREQLITRVVDMQAAALKLGTANSVQFAQVCTQFLAIAKNEQIPHEVVCANFGAIILTRVKIVHAGTINEEISTFAADMRSLGSQLVKTLPHAMAIVAIFVILVASIKIILH